jgi:hypothetical protein
MNGKTKKSKNQTRENELEELKSGDEEKNKKMLK